MFALRVASAPRTPVVDVTAASLLVASFGLRWQRGRALRPTLACEGQNYSAAHSLATVAVFRALAPRAPLSLTVFTCKNNFAIYKNGCNIEEGFCEALRLIIGEKLTRASRQETFSGFPLQTFTLFFRRCCLHNVLVAELLAHPTRNRAAGPLFPGKLALIVSVDLCLSERLWSVFYIFLNSEVKSRSSIGR